MTIRYDRKLDEKHLVHFKEHGLLNFFISQPIIPDHKKFPGLAEFDLQFREDNNVAVYCGLTKILNIKFYQRGNIPFTFQANKEYKNQSCFPVIQNYTEQHLIKDSIRNYFKNVVVAPHWWNKEGLIQTTYYSICATNWNESKPVGIFDKEIVIGFPSNQEKDRYNERYFKEIGGIKQKLEGIEKWAQFNNKLPEEIDLLGISSEGDSLYLIEVKADNAKSDQIYYSPFQLLYYLNRLKDAIRDNPEIKGSINALVKQKKDIGLFPTDFPQLTQIKKIIPVLAVMNKNWSHEVDNRLNAVIKCINANANDDMADFEIWEIEDGNIKRTSI